jgi:acyl-[acyl-carrier-protein] desaturase
MEFFETAERKRRWNVWDDIPWEKLDSAKNDELDAIRLETNCGVELYLPDYTSQGFNYSREIFGQAWFAANWCYEESKHALVFREYLIRSGLRTEEEYLDFEEKVLAMHWTTPADGMRQTAIYAAFQELATYHIYHQQYLKAVRDDNEVLQRILRLVGRDEAAHCGFYRKIVQFELEEDPAGTLADIAHVVSNFQMPGADLIPDYKQRMTTEGAGLTREQFMLHIMFPSLKHFGVTRADLARARQEQRGRAEATINPAIAEPAA